MSNIGIIIPERAADIGNFMVGRLLPFIEKRSVGPFVFIDHMGPADLKDYQNLDVPPHPHIGLYLRHTDKRLHGLQIWVALPKHLEGSEPSFHHTEAADIPAWETDGVHYKLIAGEAFGKTSPVPVHSKLYFIEIKTGDKPAKISIGNDLYGESALYILEGNIKSEGNTYEPKFILIAKDAKLCEFEMDANTTVYIFGGDPFPEERYIHWNFVNSDKQVIEQAKHDWKDQKFPKVPGETEFVPLPATSLK